MQIAIDGPAGAGKSTVAKLLAEQLGIMYLDTGAMYRAVALGLKERGADLADRSQIVQLLPQIRVDVRYENGAQHTLLNGEDVSDQIRTAQMGQYASSVAVIPEVRHYLVEQQRSIALRDSIILDGRDIGSYVLPDADFKVFLTASPRARAERRLRDLEAQGEKCDLDELEQEIRARDERDMNREFAPLMHTPGEILVDTSDMTQDEVIARLSAIISDQR